MDETPQVPLLHLVNDGVTGDVVGVDGVTLGELKFMLVLTCDVIANDIDEIVHPNELVWLVGRLELHPAIQENAHIERNEDALLSGAHFDASSSLAGLPLSASIRLASSNTWHSLIHELRR